ncbi:DUF2806 domain-containing protein [Methylobacterium marchantiae]|uniref:DUF2806 domain-containing protein n=1 Tax=Methylobacterium marchantiae TaxID=600331 RepID=A0ABW3WWF6_9HYPH
MAKEAAKQGIKDTDRVSRLIDRWTGEQFGFQQNRESIAYKTAEHLSDGESLRTETPPPDDDWMNFYSSFAEKATSEKLQDTWARVLAGEIRKPGTFSLRTIQFISTLDSEIAKDFGDIADVIFEDRLLFHVFVGADGESFDRVRRLNDVGLLGNAISWTKTYDNKMSLIQNKFYTLCLQTEWGIDYKFNAYPLTKVGGEIYSIMSVNNDFKIVRDFTKAITRSSRAQRIDILRRKETLEETFQGQSLGHTELVVDHTTGNFVEVTFTEHV